MFSPDGREAELALLVQQIQDYAVFLLDPAGHVQTWNAGAARIHGYETDDVVGRHFSLFYPDPHGPAPAHALRDAAASGRHEDEGWRMRRDGTRLWANVVLTAIRDEAGALIGYGQVVRDLSSRHASEQLLRSILDTTLDAIISINARGEIQSFNQAAERLFGYAAREVLGQNVRLLMPEPDRSRHDGYLGRHLATGERRIIGTGRQVTGRRRDGATFPMDLAVSEFSMETGTHFAGIIRDLSERNRLEEQLRHAQKMDAMGQLAGGIAHDFNNLLTIITGYCELLVAGATPADHAYAVEQIATAAEKAATLTGQLLAFSRKAVVTPRQLDLNAAIEDIQRMLRRVIGEDIALESRLGPGPLWVTADAGQLAQVIVNLAVNARDAMPTGGRLRIATARTSLTPAEAFAHGMSPGPVAVLTVQDTGVGIAPDIASRVFEPFFTTKPPGRGTGLGLATVYGIVRQCGGGVAVDSEQGRGTTFTVYLPVTEPRLPATSGGAGAGQDDRGSETVLLVEDEPEVRRIAVTMLEARGYRVLAASAPEQADVLADGAHVDLLVTDVVMPGTSGVEVAERLRARHPSLKVLYMSGYNDDAILRHGVMRRHAAFLQKPFTGRQLTRLVREILDAPAAAGDSG